MPSSTRKQARLMAAVAHGWHMPGGGGPPVSVAKDFNAADVKTGILRRKGKGGIVRGRPPGALKMAMGGSAELEQTARELGGQSFQAIHDPALRASMKARLAANPALLHALTQYAGRYLPPGFSDEAMSAFSKSPVVGGTGKPAARGPDPDEVLSTLTRALYYQSAGSSPQQPGSDPNARPLMPQQAPAAQVQDNSGTTSSYARGGLGTLEKILKETPEESTKRLAREAKMARTGTPGFFSTLDELIRSSPKAAMTAPDWANYLRPGAPLVRGDVKFRLKPDELTQTGIGDYLRQTLQEHGQLPEPPMIGRQALRDVAFANRPRMDFENEELHPSQMTYYRTAQGETPALNVGNSTYSSGRTLIRPPPSSASALPGMTSSGRFANRLSDPDLLSASTAFTTNRGGDLVTHVGSLPHELAQETLIHPSAQAMEELRTALAGTPMEGKLKEVASRLGLERSSLAAGVQPEAGLHPMFEAKPRGYGTPDFQTALSNWASERGLDVHGPDRSAIMDRFASETGRDAGSPSPSNQNVPYRGSAFSALELRRRLLDAANRNREFLGLAAPEDINDRSAFQTQQFSSPLALPKQLRKLASQYGLTTDISHPVANPERNLPSPTFLSHYYPETYPHDLVQTNPAAPRTSFSEAFQREMAPFANYDPATASPDEKEALRAAKRNLLVGAMRLHHFVTSEAAKDPLLSDIEGVAKSQEGELNPLLESMTRHYQSTPYAPFHPDHVPKLLDHMETVDSLLNDAVQRQRAQVAASDQPLDPIRRLAAKLSPEDAERIRKIGVPLFSSAAMALGAQLPKISPDGGEGDQSVQQFARGGLAKLADILGEPDELTNARQLAEAKAAGISVPGFFSTLHEAIKDAPFERAPANQWYSYLQPGRMHERSGMKFPVKKEELQFTGIHDHLGALSKGDPEAWANYQKPEDVAGDTPKPINPQAPVAKEDLANWLERTRPQITLQTKATGAGERPEFGSFTAPFAQDQTPFKYRTDVMSLTAPPEMVEKGQQFLNTGPAGPHFLERGNVPLVHTRGFDTPKGHYMNELQSQLGSWAKAGYLVPKQGDLSKLQSFIARSPAGMEQDADPQELLRSLTERYIGAPKYIEPPTNRLLRENGVPAGQSVVKRDTGLVPDLPPLDPRFPFIDLQKGHGLLALKQRLLDLAQWNRPEPAPDVRSLAFPTADDATYAAGWHGLGRRGGDWDKVMHIAYGLEGDPAAKAHNADVLARLAALQEKAKAENTPVPKNTREAGLPALQPEKGMIFQPAQELQQQYGLGFDPNHLIAGKAPELVDPNAPANGLKPPFYAGPESDIKQTILAQTQHLPSYRARAEQALTLAQQALAHYASLPETILPRDQHQYDLDEAQRGLDKGNTYLQTAAPELTADDYNEATWEPLYHLRNLDRSVTHIMSPSSTVSRADKPVYRPAITMTPEKALFTRKTGFPLFKTGGEVEAQDFAEGGSVEERPGYLKRAYVAALPLWMGRDAHGKLVSLLSHMNPHDMTHPESAMHETGLGDTIAGIPADLHNLLYAVAKRVAPHATEFMDSIPHPHDPLTQLTAKVMGMSQSASDRGSKLREDIMAEHHIPPAQNWKERLADTSGEMLGSVPFPFGEGKAGLGIAEYIVPTIKPSIGNYLTGIGGGTILKEGIPHLMPPAADESEPYMLDGPPRSFGPQD